MKKILFLGLILLSFSLVSADTIPKEWNFYINNKTIKFNFNEDYNFTGIIYANQDNLNINNNYIFNLTAEEGKCNVSLITLNPNSTKWNTSCPNTTDWVYHKIGNFSQNMTLYIDDVENQTLTPTDNFITFNYTGGFSTHTFELNSNVSTTEFSVYLNSPINGASTTDLTPDFNFTVNGSESTYDCTLYLNNTNKGNNATTNNNTLTTITSSILSIGTYNWYVNCTAGGITNQSETRTINLYNISYNLPTIMSDTKVIVDQDQYYNFSVNITSSGNITNFNLDFTDYYNETIYSNNTNYNIIINITSSPQTEWINLTGNTITQYDTTELNCPSGYTEYVTDGKAYCKFVTGYDSIRQYYYIQWLKVKDNSSKIYEINMSMPYITEDMSDLYNFNYSINGSTTNLSFSTANKYLIIGTSHSTSSLSAGNYLVNISFEIDVTGSGGTGGNTPIPICGDGECEYPENLTTCPDDCGICGNNICEIMENATNCPEDCISYINMTGVYPETQPVSEQFYDYLFSEIGRTPSGFICYRWMPIILIIIILGGTTYYLNKRKERIVEKVSRYLKKQYFKS